MEAKRQGKGKGNAVDVAGRVGFSATGCLRSPAIFTCNSFLLTTPVRTDLMYGHSAQWSVTEENARLLPWHGTKYA